MNEIKKEDLKISGFEIKSAQVAEIDFDLNGANSSSILSNYDMRELEKLYDFGLKIENLLYKYLI